MSPPPPASPVEPLSLAVPKVDFLPSSYLKARHKRHRARWRRIVLAACLLLIVAGSLRQWQLARQLKGQRAAVASKVARLHAQIPNPQHHQQRVQTLEQDANLLATLRLQPATTRIMTETIAALPNHVQLTRYHHTTQTHQKVRAARPGLPVQQPGPETGPPLAADLKQLRETRQQQRLIIEIEGIARNDRAVSAYLQRLEDRGLFVEVDLLYADGGQRRGEPVRNFGIRLRVRPPMKDPPRPALPTERATPGAVDVPGPPSRPKPSSGPTASLNPGSSTTANRRRALV